MPHKDPVAAKAYAAAHYIRNKAERDARARVHYEANRELIRSQQAEYREANREHLVQRDRDRYATNKDEMLAQQAEFRRANPDLIRQRNRDAYWRDPESHRAAARQYHRDNPEAARRAFSIRRAKKRGVHSERVSIAVLIERDADLCHICGLPCSDSDRVHEHVIPLSRGGPNTYANSGLAHRRCNLRKGTKIVESPLLATALVEFERCNGAPFGVTVPKEVVA